MHVNYVTGSAGSGDRLRETLLLAFARANAISKP